MAPNHPQRARRRLDRTMRIGVLTGGGDRPASMPSSAPSCGPATPAMDPRSWDFQDGWRGPAGEPSYPTRQRRPQRPVAGQGRHHAGHRPDQSREAAGRHRRHQTDPEDNGIDVLIPIGGEGTLTAAHWLTEEGVPVVGVPKTIDNDIDCTDVTFGHDTALMIATEAIDRLHSTAESHQRVMLVEVMGRHAGWIALNAGLASGAHMTLIPEQPYDVEEVCRLVKQRFQRGASHFICVVAEGPKPPRARWNCGTVAWTSSATSGSPASPSSWGTRWRRGSARRSGHRPRHIQRGGKPTAYDRAGYPLRGQRRRCRARRRVRDDGVAAGRTSAGFRWPTRCVSSSWCRRAATTTRRPSSAECARRRKLARSGPVPDAIWRLLAAG